MAKAYLLQKLHDYKPKKHYVGSSFISEKLDGVRGWWDGGVTTGLPKGDPRVPWAYTGKDARFRSVQYCTGFWTQNGNVVHAPKWLIESMPPIALDFEFYSPEMAMEEIVSVVRSLDCDDPRWKMLKCHVFNVVPVQSILMARNVNEAFCKLDFDGRTGYDLFKNYQGPMRPLIFREAYRYLLDNIPGNHPYVVVHNQVQLDQNETTARAMLDIFADNLFEKGSEGVVIANQCMVWTPERNHAIVKYKAIFDSEGEVVDFVTADVGKLLGRIGAVRIKWENITFEISGTSLNSQENEFATYEAEEWAKTHPRQLLPTNYDGRTLKRGSRVTFKYRKLSSDGVPIEARFKMIRNEGE